MVIELRAITPDDRERLVSMYDRLSPEARLRRFLTPKPALSARELAFLTEVDQVRHVAVAAVDRRDGSIVGTARYVQEARRPWAADVAIEVVDEHQNRGIGVVLAAAIVERARANGFRLLTATTLWDNRPARALLRRFRFRPRASSRGEIELERALEPSTS